MGSWQLAIAIGVGVGLAYGLREAFPAMIRGTTQIQPTLKQGQRVTIGGMTTGTVQEAGSFSVILKDDQGRTIVIPTKNILDKEIVIESGPAPATQEKAVEENRGSSSRVVTVIVVIISSHIWLSNVDATTGSLQGSCHKWQA